MRRQKDLTYKWAKGLNRKFTSFITLTDAQQSLGEYKSKP